MNPRGEEGADIISSLPDFVILHILSFLDMIDVVRTSILSNRWRGLWTSVPCLSFDQYKYEPPGSRNHRQHCDDIHDFFDPDFAHWCNMHDNAQSDADAGAGADRFIKFVERSLVLYAGYKVQKFSLACDYNKKFIPYVDAWILCAVRRGVKDLYLDFTFCTEIYQMPSWLLKCHGLTSLSLNKCPFDVPKIVQLNSLKTLEISWISLESGSIPALLSGCPLLEELILEACEMSSGRLQITSSSSSGLPLKRLTIWNCSSRSGGEIVVEIQAPYLQALRISGFKVYKNSLKNIPSLREARISIYSSRATLQFCRTLVSWLHDLQHVKVLELCGECIKGLSFLTELPSYSLKAKCLALNFEFGKSEFRAVACLLWCSNELESLIIDLIPKGFFHLSPNPAEDEFDRVYWEKLKKSFPSIFRCLRSVKISGFMKVTCRSVSNSKALRSAVNKQNKEVALVRFFLSNASSLEKITIKFAENPNFVDREEWSQILSVVSKKLFALCRASSCAELSLLYK